jgi:LacI family transcriptional regulator
MKKKISLKDIAAHLEVSKTLVSMVLNGRGEEYRINEDVIKKVKKAAEELNYQPNKMAQSLRTGRTNTIGLIIADIANPFFATLGREIELEAAKHGYQVMFCSSDENPQKFKKQLELMQRNMVDGFILSAPIGSEQEIEALNSANVPYVLIDRYFSDIPSNYVIINNFDSAYDATKYLIKKGKKRIANITLNMGLKAMKDRTEGYQKALEDSGIIANKNWIRQISFSHNNEEILDAIKSLNESETIDAILFSTSKIALMGIQCLFELGLKIPDDISVITFDDPDSLKICNPTVTAIAQPLEQMGIKSISVLLNQILNKNNNLEKSEIILNTRFFIRNSC